MLQVVDSIQKIIAGNYAHWCLVAANGDFLEFGFKLRMKFRSDRASIRELFFLIPKIQIGVP